MAGIGEWVGGILECGSDCVIPDVYLTESSDVLHNNRQSSRTNEQPAQNLSYALMQYIDSVVSYAIIEHAKLLF